MPDVVFLLLLSIPVWLLLGLVALVTRNRAYLDADVVKLVLMVLYPLAFVALCLYAGFCDPQVRPIWSPPPR